MTSQSVAHRRLLQQHIVGSALKHPAEVGQSMLAMQAQDYEQALWAVALRTITANRAQVEAAIAQRQLVLTWPMRGTIHLLAASDLRWVLERCAPRRVAGDATRLRQLELDETILERCGRLLRMVLQGGQAQTRSTLLELLRREGIDPSGQRGYHILWRLAQSGLICFGPRRGKEQSFVLLEEWLPEPPDAPRLSPDAALAELARRYFVSHGPATVQDFAHWTGLSLREARAGLEAVQGQLVSERQAALEYWWGAGARELPVPASLTTELLLLPGFDEYLLGYKDRHDVLSAAHAGRVVPGGNGMFLPILVLNGQVVGTWRRSFRAKGVKIALSPFVDIPDVRSKVQAAAQRYCQFLGMPLLDISLA